MQRNGCFMHRKGRANLPKGPKKSPDLLAQTGARPIKKGSRKDHFVNGMYHTVASLNVGSNDVGNAVLSVCNGRTTC